MVARGDTHVPPSPVLPGDRCRQRHTVEQWSPEGVPADGILKHAPPSDPFLLFSGPPTSRHLFSASSGDSTHAAISSATCQAGTRGRTRHVSNLARQRCNTASLCAATTGRHENTDVACCSMHSTPSRPAPPGPLPARPHLQAGHGTAKQLVAGGQLHVVGQLVVIAGRLHAACTPKRWSGAAGYTLTHLLQEVAFAA